MSKVRKLAVENLETRRVLAASLGWDGPGAGGADLTYYVGDAPQTLSQSQFETAIETALAAWSDVVDVDFTRTNQPGLRDSLDFTSRNLDGPGGTLAQAYFPDDVNPAQIAGDVQFDSSENWEIGNALGSSAFDLVAVAVHEIGHSLGLDHIAHAGSVLLPSISANVAFAGLSQHDIDAIRELYAPNESLPSDGTTEQDANTPRPPSDPSGSGVDRDRQRNDRSPNPWNRIRWTVQFEGRIGGGSWGNGTWFGQFWSARFGQLAAQEIDVHNWIDPTDVNEDSITTPIDALLVINSLNNRTSLDALSHKCDTNDDGFLSAMDALLVINRLNQRESASPSVTDSAAHQMDPLPTSVEGDLQLGDIDQTSQTELTDRLLNSLGFRVGGQLGGITEAAAESLFESFDENSDGALSESEVPEFVWGYLTQREVDANDDGSVTLPEINEALEAYRLRRFNEVDANEDGFITQLEVGDRYWARLSRADTDGDAAVTFEEVETYSSRSRFERLDANSDGTITSDEVSEQRWQRLSRFDSNADNALTAGEFPTPLEERLAPTFDRLSNIASNIFRFIRNLR